MCPRCIYKRICKYLELEMSKTAADDACMRFHEIPDYNADESEDKFLV